MSSRPIDSAAVASAVAELVGLTINKTRRAVDMEMLDFGPQQERPDRNGRPIKIGAFGLHIQVPWRIIEADRVVVGYGDIREPPSGGASSEWDSSEMYPSLRDVLLVGWLSAPNEPRRVVAAEARRTGDLRLTFDHGSILEILVDSAGESREYWRLLRRDAHDHLVVGGNGAVLWFD